MLDMSWGELMVIGGVALVVIGPKDLPRALRTVGQMTTKVRRLAGEFQSQFNEAMREAELEDVRKEMEGLNRTVMSATNTAFNPIQTLRDEIKGAVEARPAASNTIHAAVSPEGAAVPAAPVVEEGGPVPQIEPAPAPSPAPHAEPVAPSTEVTGPGLEQTESAPHGHPAPASHPREMPA